MFGFACAFLMISPDLRNTAFEAVNSAAVFVQQYSPYSYFAAAVLVFGGATLTLRTGQSLR
jgi:hypothetical protein